MSQSPDPTQVPASGDIVVTATLDDLSQSRNLLHFTSFGFFVQAWRIDRNHPRCVVAVGSLFTYVSALRPSVTLDQPRCILGGDPAMPARLKVTLITTPDGAPETWTSDAVSLQTMEIEVPKVEPWILAPEIHRLKNRRAYEIATERTAACPPQSPAKPTGL